MPEPGTSLNGTAAVWNGMSAAELKVCCANLYETPWARLLLGDSFHPGGLPLTQRLGELMGLGPGQRLLDVAAGNGSSAVTLATRFGCTVFGVDLGAGAAAEARGRAGAAGLAGSVHFVRGDSEHLPLQKEGFDAVICECSFCTFPDKAAAAREFARVLRPGGRVGLADVTRYGALPRELATVSGWVACLADAQPTEGYVAALEAAGLRVERIEPHSDALRSLAQQVRGKLAAAEVMSKLGLLPLAGVDFEAVQQLVRLAAAAIDDRVLGYVLMVGTKVDQRTRKGNY